MPALECSQLTVQTAGLGPAPQPRLALVVVVALTVVVVAGVLYVEVVAVLVAQLTILFHGWRETDATLETKH